MSTQTDSQTDVSNNNYGRRAFLRRSAAATTAAIGVGAGAHHMDRGPIGSAQAAVPIGVAVGGLALAYLAGEASDYVLGDSRDYSAYTGGDALQSEVAAGVKEMAASDERTLNAIENNVKAADTVALSKGKVALIEHMNDGADENTATDHMFDTIDDYFAVIQENLIQHWNAQTKQHDHHVEQVTSHEDLDRSLFLMNGGGSVGYVRDLHETTTELLNGDEVDYWFKEHANDTDEGKALDFREEYESVDSSSANGWHGTLDYMSFVDTDDTEHDYMNASRFSSIWDDLLATRDDTVATLSGFASDVYNQYDEGDIPTEELVDPITAATELEQDYDSTQGQMAFAALAGIPTNAEESVFLDAIDDPIDTDGMTSDEIDSAVEDAEKTEISADLFTEHVPEDDDGNEVGFEVGEFYEPDQWEKPLYIAYERIYEDDDGDVVEESDFVQLEDQFVVKSAEDADGNSIDTFQNDSQNTQTADVDELEAELEQLREEQVRLQEEAQNDGGGAPFSIGGMDFGAEETLIGGLVLALLGGYLTN